MSAKKTFTDIDWQQVPHAKVKGVIEGEIKRGRCELADILPTCVDFSKAAGYRRHYTSYQVDAGIQAVWDAYITTDTSIAWNSELISYSFMFCQEQNRFYYPGQSAERIRERQMVFLNLNILGGLIKVPVAHWIDRLNKEDYCMRLCYLDVSKTGGSQEIRLVRLSDHKTEIQHETYYKGDSAFRDKYLYPYFHGKAIDQFHDNIFSQLDPKV